MPTITLGELAQLLEAELRGAASDTIVSSVAPLDEATEGQLTFLADLKYSKLLAKTKATVVILTEDNAAESPVPVLVVDNPKARFGQVAQIFQRQVKQATGVHPTAVIGTNCDISPSVSIGPLCVIGDDVKVGSDTIILPGTVVGAATEIGAQCLLHANVTIYPRSVLGNKVVIHSGAVIGSDGFGNSNENGQWTKTPQLGRAVIKDHVEIGANTTIDCGAIGDTVVGTGVKLDNLIQVGHNVRIGDHTAIAAQTGIAGSTSIGKYCMIAGQVGIAGHLKLCDGVILTGQSGVRQSISKSGVYSCSISVSPYMEWNKVAVRLKKLNIMYKDILALKKAQKEKEVIT